MVTKYNIEYFKNKLTELSCLCQEELSHNNFKYDLEVTVKLKCECIYKKQVRSFILSNFKCNKCDKSERIRYNIDYLKLILSKHNACLDISYNIVNPSRETKINYICGCGIKCSNKFIYIAKYSGPYCSICLYSNKIHINYDSLLLNYIITKYSSKLIGQYNNLVRDTLINYQCICGTKYSKIFRNLVEYGGAYCKECTISSKQNKFKNTNIQIYGADHPLKNENVINKIKQTMYKKYGVYFSMNYPEFRDKAKQTLFKNFNVYYPSQSEIIKHKIRTTCLLRYNYNNPAKNDLVKEKTKNTCLLRYGVSSYLVSTEYFQKYKEQSFRTKKFTINGITKYFQGYEHFAYSIMVEQYSDNDIENLRYKVPVIIYERNHKEHRYFPDFYIKKDNLLIEVKSVYTYIKDFRKGKIDGIVKSIKKDNIYKYKIWIIHRKGYIINRLVLN